jgi:sugar lactone lactonase YvrE
VPLQVDVVLDAGAEIGEGPVWDPVHGTLLWLDIARGLVHRLSPDTGADVALDVGQPVGAVAARRGGGLVLAMRDGFGLLDAAADAPVRLVAAVESDRPDQRMNDGRCDRRGRFWAGTASVSGRVATSALYRLDADCRVVTMLSGVSMSNGIDWSPDDRQMYYVDSHTQGVDCFDYEPEAGLLGGCHRLVDVPREVGIPDGLTVDADGCLWLAVWGAGAVLRYTPRGELDLVVRVPARQVTSCTFGGADLGDLFITSAARGLDAGQRAAEPLAGAIFRVRTGVFGLPPRSFAG